MADSLHFLYTDTLNAKCLFVDSISSNNTCSELFTFEKNHYLLFWEGMGSVTLYVFLMVLLVFLFYRKDRVLDFCGRYLTYAFFVVWAMGFVVYDLGMYPDRCQNSIDAFWSLLGVAPMAIIHAFGMFLFQSDVSAIHDGCHNDCWYMFFFSISHLLAAFISLIFVIKHFGFNIATSIIRFLKTYLWFNNIKNLYVFWGMNDATYCLAKDIVNKGKLKDSKIIIIRISNEKEDANERIGMERLLSFLSLTKNNLKKLQELQKLGCLTTSTFGSLINIRTSSENDILRNELRLFSLLRLMHRTEGTVHMFFLENDESFNILPIANLKKDREIKSFMERNGKVKFYCHARYNSIHRVIEDELTDEKMEVKVVDSSHINVELLKKTPEFHPVRYVNVESDATVSSPFNALVIGFGEVGMDSVRFLYEFGAFVKNGQHGNAIERSEFHCHVIDQNMDDLAGLFVVNAPSIITTKNEVTDENLKMINLYNMDCRSVEFYNRLKQWITSLNYIIVATGDDETNMSMAVRIFRQAIRERNDCLKQFRILVRVQHDENGHIQKIAEHYNRIWAANKRSTDTYHLHQHVISSSEQIDTPITLFGSDNQVYTYEHIVSDSLKDDAKKFKKKYDLSINELRRMAGAKPNEIVDWDNEQNQMMQLNGDHKGFAPTFSGMMKLRRIQSQNNANSLHRETKKWLAKTALGQEGYENMMRHGLVRSETSLAYSWKDHSNLPLDNVQKVMDVLAQTEHLRWNASHEILGYQMGKDDDGFKDEAKLLHGCLKDWNKLNDITKTYDYNIVDVSLDIIDINEEML